MIRLSSALTEGPATLAKVRRNLQNAVELEHATIPVYLYGLYSVMDGTNRAIASIIQSVVVEEMLHMTLACNVLNAIGGSPVIDKPDFIPNYNNGAFPPGTNLPGGVDSGLLVALAPFSMNQLGTYLGIEEPANPIVIPGEEPQPRPPQPGTVTIGDFYNNILSDLQTLVNQGPSPFVSPARNQIGPDILPDAVIVSDLTSATQAINTIIDQGEGTSTSPKEQVGKGYAHYYRFMQIQEGALLQPDNANPAGYDYNGEPVPFEPTGVYNVLPAAAPLSSMQRLQVDNFNYTYTSLLKSLHTLFNGTNTHSQLNVALGLMMSLKGQAKAMMKAVPNSAAPGFGPTFEFFPVNPTVPTR